MVSMTRQPQFAAITLGPSQPLKGKAKAAVGSPGQQRDEMKAVETILNEWMSTKKPELDKLTKNHDIEVIVDANPGYSWAPKSQLMGARFYKVEEGGKKTKLEVRWQTLSGGPLIEKDFKSWAMHYFSEKEHFFNRLTKALKMGIQNIGTVNDVTYNNDR